MTTPVALPVQYPEATYLRDLADRFESPHSNSLLHCATKIELLNRDLNAAHKARLVAEQRLSEAQPVKLWECPECCFSFPTLHSDADGGYSCPVCAESTLTGELSACRRAIPDTPDFDFLAGKTLTECVEALVAGVPYAVALQAKAQALLDVLQPGEPLFAAYGMPAIDAYNALWAVVDGGKTATRNNQLPVRRNP